MRDDLSQSLGETASFFVTARNSKQEAVAFAPGDTLVGKFSRGKDQASLLTPVLSWADAPGGKAQVIITAASLAGAAIVPGQYHLEIFGVPSDGQPRGILDTGYVITPSAGTGTAPAVYAGPDDLTTYAPEIATLLARDVTETNFADQRARARSRFEQARIDRYRPQAGRSRRFVAGCDVFAPAPDGSPPPTEAQLRAWFAADRLIVTRDIVEANARYAAALVYLASPGSRNDYAELGRREMVMAEAMFADVVVDFDATATVPATAGTVRIDRDVTYLT